MLDKLRMLMLLWLVFTIPPQCIVIYSNRQKTSTEHPVCSAVIQWKWLKPCLLRQNTNSTGPFFYILSSLYLHKRPLADSKQSTHFESGFIFSISDSSYYVTFKRPLLSVHVVWGPAPPGAQYGESLRLEEWRSHAVLQLTWRLFTPDQCASQFLASDFNNNNVLSVAN